MTEAALKLVELPEVRQLETKTLSITDRAASLIISNSQEFADAGELLLIIKDARKEVANTFGPIKSKQHEAWKETVAQEKRHDEPLVRAETIIKQKIGVYTEAEEKKRREEEARIQAELRKQEEEDRLRLAVATEQAGDSEQAEAILNEPAYVAPVVVPKSTPQVAGISTRQVWDFQIVDPSKVPDQYKVVDEKKISGVVRSLGAQANIPGVKVFQRTVVAAGRR